MAGLTLGKEKQPSRRRRLGRSLCRGPSPGALGKELFFFLKKSLPRASNHGPRQRNVAEFFQKIFAEGNGTALGKELFFFFEKSLPRASPQALGKEILIFFKKSLCRGPPTMAVGKEMFQNFSNEYLPRAMVGKGPFFAEGLGHCPRQRGRNLIFFLFFAFHQHKHFIYIYICISTITYIYHTEPIFS